MFDEERHLFGSREKSEEVLYIWLMARLRMYAHARAATRLYAIR